MKATDKREEPIVREAIRFLNEEYEARKDFNESFDADEPIKIGGLAFSKSKALFWLDRDAYYEAQEDWLDESLQEKHEACTALLKTHGLETPFRELSVAIERGRIVPFVGAGMSRPMGMPLWGEALKELLGRLPSADLAGISAQIEAGQYLAAAEALFGHNPVQAKNFISTKYRIQKLAGPMALLPRIGRGCVITTNFDDAIEQTYRGVNVEFQAYMHGTQEHNFFPRLVRGDRCLLKLHGDADNPGTYILTQTQYADGYRRAGEFDFHKPLPKALRQVFVSQSLLFLGCSLEQDWTLELFEKAKQADEYAIPNHYAILPAPEKASAKQEKATRLLTLNIQPLWYPAGEHEFVERYLQFIVDVAERRISYKG